MISYLDNGKWPGVACNCNVFGVQETQHRRLKIDTPCEKKDAKYFEKRKRNNMAAKKSREAKRRRDNEVSDDFCFVFRTLSILEGNLSKFINNNIPITMDICKTLFSKQLVLVIGSSPEYL